VNAIFLIDISTHRSSSPAPLIFWGVIGFCAGIYLFVQGFRLLQRRRLILDTPFSKIRSASMGMVEISGLAVGPYTTTAPITERECYFYRTLVWEYQQRGKNKEWVKVAGECMHMPFFVDDNSGRVLVNPRGADLDLHCDFEQEFCDSFFTTKEPAPSNVRAFLANHGIVTRNKIKVQECCIKPKNSLFILGTLAENPGLEVTAQAVRDDDALATTNRLSLGGGGLSFSASVGGSGFHAEPMTNRRSSRSLASPQVVRISLPAPAGKSSNMSQQQKIAAALQQAGISNPEVWGALSMVNPPAQGTPDQSAVASVPAGQEDSANGDALAKIGFDPHPPVVLMKGENNKAFMISWRSQQEVARTLGWKCTLMIWGGPVLALLSLYILVNVLQL
jgi:hypothetical protein